MSLWDEITRDATASKEVWEWDGSRFCRSSWGGFVRLARHAAYALRRRGVGRGSIVPAIFSNGPAVPPGAMGVWFAGATLASLPIMARGMSVAEYSQQLTRICQLLGAEILVIEERFLKLMPPGVDLGVTFVSFEELVNAPGVQEIEPPSLEDTIFIQFSSGTTAEPRGVELSGRAIETHMRTFAEHIAIDPSRDTGCIWLPQSHDMGFFGGTMLAWYSGMAGVKSWPERFLQSPHTWFDDCSRFKATITAAPPMALWLAARAQRAHPSNAPLQIRRCMVGAEHIDWRGLENVVDALSGRGLTLAALTPAYGMAEATLVVTVAAQSPEPEFIDVDARALDEQQVVLVAPDHADGRRLVSCGRCLPGVTVSCDQASGEIIVRSPSLGSGYVGDDAATRERFADGAFRTSDLGFIRDDQLFVIGRADDCVIVGGRNIHVQKIEQQVSVHAAIRKGNCVIVEAPRGSGRIGLVAEVLSETSDPTDVALALRSAAIRHGGPPISDFAFVPRGTFPKTPSGKAQRYRCRTILAAEEPGTRVRLGAGTTN